MLAQKEASQKSPKSPRSAGQGLRLADSLFDAKERYFDGIPDPIALIHNHLPSEFCAGK